MYVHLRRLVALWLLMCGSSVATAASVTTSKVMELGIIPSTNVVWMKMAGPVSTPATCATPGYFALNISTDIAKQVYKMILTGQVQNLPLTVYGTGACSVSSGSEDIKYVWFNPPTN